MEITINNKTYDREQFLKLFDHTILKLSTTDDVIIEECKKSCEYNVASVVVQPAYISLISGLLKGTSVKPGVPIGFPHGGHTTETKVFESKKAFSDGARELDMVINILKLHSKDYDYVRDDIQQVVKVGHGEGAIVKAILCTGYLSQEEMVIGCQLAEEAGADFVKTSTGFDPSGALPENIKLMRNTVSPSVGVKAAQGVSTFEKAIEMIEAGANRLGTSSTFKIIESFLNKQ
jgi:deoxyribose-phosphate aldolase